MTSLDQLRSRLGERYRIERELGRGGMGAVYLARDLRLDRPVALKVLPSEFAALPALRERFLRETKTAAGFSHPNIVPVYAIEEAEDLLAYAMGFVEGETLAERVRRAGTLSVRETVKLLQDVGYALAYAHGRGVVHRDIKPDNVMLERATGRALVMDFGIARAITAAPAAGAGLTRVGEVVGTPEYMSPEQATGENIDGRSDLYSLGLTAWFALTGQPAMSGDSTGRILARQISETLPPMITVRPDLPPALADAIDRCLAKEPSARFASAEGLVETLDEAQLAAPEIPLAVRMFAQEASTLNMVLIGGGLFVFLLVRSFLDNPNNLDNLVPLAGVLAILATRKLQTLSEARRLAADGFGPGEIERGLAAVMDERATRRLELRADERTRRARRRTVGWALGMLAMAVLLIRFAFTFRTQIGPRAYTTATPGVVLVLSGMALLGMSLVLLLRSPFRMPLGERIFRAIWLGPVGRTFLRVAAWGLGSTGGRAGASAPGMTRATRVPPPAPAAPATAVDGAGDRIAALETRLAELERWRETH
jgi:serine/threonine-protein kinase